MAEFRIGKMGKKILKILEERERDIPLNKLIYMVYFKKYENGEYNPHVFTTFSEKVSVYNAVKRLEKRRLIDFKREYTLDSYLRKNIFLTQFGEDYIKSSLTFNKHQNIKGNSLSFNKHREIL